MDKADWIGLKDLLVGYEVDVANLVAKHTKEQEEKDKIIQQLQEQLNKPQQFTKKPE